MCGVFRMAKYVAFTFNIVCLILATIVIVLNTLGLERSLPNTDEHAYFIVGIILGSLVCMTTMIGCYGVVCELLGVNVVYSLFILLFLVFQYMQMQSYPTRKFYMNAVDRLGHAWRLIDTQPHLMSTVEETYHCCGLYDSRDYNYKDLTIPKSCYAHKNMKIATNLYAPGCLEMLHNFYQQSVKKEKFYNWSLFVTECFVFFTFCIFMILVYRQRRREPIRYVRDPEIVRRPIQNHTSSRSALFSN